MKNIIIKNTAINSDSIKVIEKTSNYDVFGIDFYCNIGDIGKLIHVDFTGYLAIDADICDIAYNFIICYITNKISGIINIETLIKSLSDIYDKTIQVHCNEYEKYNDIRNFKVFIISEYKNNLLKFAEQMI